MIIDTDKWREILITLKQHKLRTALTAFGVFWGIFMLSILLGAGNGLENGITNGFPQVPNTVTVWSANQTQLPYRGMSAGRRVTLEADDVDAIEAEISEVAFVKGQNSIGIWGGTPPYTVHGSNNGTFFVQGSHEGMASFHSLEVEEGRYINRIDTDNRRKVAVIGARVKDILFEPGENPIGASITINGISFLVIGTFKSLSSGNRAPDEERIYIPNDTLRYAFNQMWGVGSLIVQPKPGIHASVVEDKIKQLLAQRHMVHPDDVSVFGSFNLQNEYDKIQGLFLGIRAFSWVVAIGTIMAGAIGVGNIMLIVVKERTREIGLRKALGATPRSIVAMIVQESVLITTVAGYAGLVVGVFLLEAVAAMLATAGNGSGMFASPEIDFQTGFIAVATLVVAGVLAALLPAAKAARVDAIVALQAE